MDITIDTITKICPESEIFESVLPLDNQDILELGCGDATLTRLIASTGEGRRIIATEVDDIQHQKNVLINDLPNVSFLLAGSENIPAVDNSIDIVLMFKSFHHVPKHLMAQALQEVKRVLKPDAMLYISEPVFAGEFNDILRLFHDEESVRKAAFETIKNAVDDKHYSLENELFFNTPVTFDDFDEFEKRVIGATHSEHQLSDELYDNVKNKFNQCCKNNSGEFLIPIRVDILRNIK
ncbi:MAG: class I SAM-dependent methyltransferase [gamma proteobacterium symbiont of Bathyaustriella thionipta]|nr:class I SAM-dependent methyltransferase [gamma proteobacterium symbiont of Bathyaustriella thionipta]MCU7951541.1 class I SAM-dependent methyltransferase [gamma proteobacterium symbiont of Bathyaustriella thionipta]MCU7958186.1 class I SAM-dependent methyltransferase [gamma proteobacterium symbiont of Bathyaustriella thionipta]MCU7965853.1 class I SAM-dependent methyltransferase [gamma proteobacterium symbiont of Bathyaustriella thionipta]